MVEESGNSLGKLLSEIPEHIDSNNDETLCVCEVFKWKHTHGDSTPLEFETLYQLEHYNDVRED
jgi:hypothetical protein